MDLYFCTKEENNFVFRCYIFNIFLHLNEISQVFEIGGTNLNGCVIALAVQMFTAKRGLLFNKTEIMGDAKSSGKEYLERKITQHVNGIEMIDMFQRLLKIVAYCIILHLHLCSFG